MVEDPVRAELARKISRAAADSQAVIATGARGLGQKTTIGAGLLAFKTWSKLDVDGNWLTGGYLAGFQKILDEAINWCGQHRPEIVTRHEQSIKRMFPLCESPHFKFPKDLTNTSSREERTRFYHHEYQNKLLVGLSEFLIEYLNAARRSVLLVIDDASAMSPTARSLLNIFLRKKSAEKLIKFVLIDYERRIFLPKAERVEFPEYSYEELAKLLGLELHFPGEKACRIFEASRGNAMLARAVLTCERKGIPVAGYLDCLTLVDLYLSTLKAGERIEMLTRYLDRNCRSEEYIEIRNYETGSALLTDDEHEKRHAACMADYQCGRAPLVTLHAQAIRDKYKRLEALAEPSEILKNIGLYDTWFTFFGEVFADFDLRGYGSGDDATNGVFINAAFVLYSLGCGQASVPFLDEFYERCPDSRFIPTVLYAQAMTYGRYSQPVDLPRAEKYARLNIKTIEARFHGYEKYHYIKVFAENAYAYIKARQGKFDEALELCMKGNQKMLEIYGADKFRLHQSILIYNTSQVYEIVKDFPLAEAQLRLAITYDPFYGEYYNDLGNLLAQLPGRETEALDAYQTAIDLCPPYYEVHLNRGILCASLGRMDKALWDFEQVLEIKPGEWRALLEIGGIYLGYGESERALGVYRKALAIEPASAELQNNAGLACSELGEVEESIAHYRKAIAIRAKNADSHNNLAIELFRAGRAEEAVEHARVAVGIGGDPDYEKNLEVILVSETVER